jgi:hypothetical protein
MRCPKCNFVSYDLSETCAKCGKNISGAAKELQGTVASIAPPSFLRFGFTGAEAKAPQGGVAESEVAFDLGGTEEAVIDLGTEEGPSPAAETLDLGLGETAAEPVDLGGPSEEKGVAEETVFALPAEEPQAAGFEISDLAPPPEAVEPEGATMAQELDSAVNQAQPPKPASAGLGLADLKVEGIDLEAAPAKGKVMPAVKTGTALDEFDIDLSELISKKEN